MIIILVAHTCTCVHMYNVHVENTLFIGFMYMCMYLNGGINFTIAGIVHVHVYIQVYTVYDNKMSYSIAPYYCNAWISWIVNLMPLVKINPQKLIHVNFNPLVLP